jgi:hypothetical protein
MKSKYVFAIIAVLALAAVSFADIGPKHGRYEDPGYFAFYEDFLGAALLTVCIELAVVGAYILYMGKKKPEIAKNAKALLAAVFVGNIISLPLVYLVSGVLSGVCLFAMLFAEGMAVAIEAAVVFVLLDGRWAKKRVLSFEEALVLSILINAASYGAGLLLGRYYLF